MADTNTVYLCVHLSATASFSSRFDYVWLERGLS